MSATAVPDIYVPYDPNEKQKIFHGKGETEVVYGGAKGGGKTLALVMEAFAYALTYPKANIYMFRETYDDLESNIIKEWRLRVPEEVYKYNEAKHRATLFNGSTVLFRYVQDKKDAEKYDGRSIDAIFVDELTKHEEATIQQLLSCLRSPMGYPPRFRASCNPGSIGHLWVKNRYIDPTDKGKKTYTDKITGNKIAFVPATVYDNIAIMNNDPAYARRLENLPPKKRAAFLMGDWDVYDGQAFEEWDPDIHLLEPFTIPDHWHRWISVDNGYSDPFAWYWFAVDEEGFVYIYREYTRDPKDPKLTYSDQARMVLNLSTYTKVYEGQALEVVEPYSVVYAGHDAFKNITHLMAGKTISYFYQQAGLVPVVSSVPDRRLRKSTWHEYLRPFEHRGEMKAKVRIFKNCKKLVETLPKMCEDENDPEKVMESSIDHWYDGAGYGLVSFHISQSKGLTPKSGPHLPWPLRKEETKEAANPFATW